MMYESVICLIDAFISIKFFKTYILPKSWFYLIKDNKITQQKIQDEILSIKWRDEKMITEHEIKKGLFECIAQTASSKNLIPAQKKTMLQNIRATFKFNSEQEMVDLYRSQITEEYTDSNGKI